MSYKAMQAISHYACAPISATAFRTLYLIASEYSDITGYAAPSIATLKTGLHKSERSLERAITELIEHGIVTREVGGGRGQTNKYRLTALIEKGDTDDTLFKGNPCTDDGVTPMETPAEMTGYTEETPAFLSENPRKNVSRVKSLNLETLSTGNEELTTGGDARAREEIPEPVKPKRQNPDTPHGRLTGWFFSTYPPELETFPGARDRIARDLRVLLTKCQDDDAEAIAAVAAFAAGMEGGDRPDCRVVCQYLGRWRMAGKPPTFHPFAKEATIARRLSLRQGPAGQSTDFADSKRRAAEQQRIFELAQQANRLPLPDGRPA